MGFWLFDLLQEEEIRNEDQLSKAFADGKIFQQISDLAMAEERYSTPPLDAVGDTLLAAHGVDLSGSLSCLHPDCLSRDLDRLLTRTWFYFDQVVVVGPSKQVIRQFVEGNSTELARIKVESMLKTLLYIKVIGAEDFLIFTEKAPACQEHYRQHLAEAGLDTILNGSEAIVDEFAINGVIDDVVSHGDHMHCTFNHPMLEHTHWPCFRTHSGDDNPKDIQRAVAEAVLADFASHLTSDVVTAQQLGTPLGLGTAVHDNLLTAGSGGAHAALALDLPILTNVPPREAMAIRVTEAASFERFRHALRQAIQQVIDTSVDDSPGAEGIAAQIIEDVIGPSLTEIDQAMQKARGLLASKAATSITSGTVLTVAGLMFSAPLLLPAGIALWGTTTLTSVHKYLEEKRDIQLNDMYFLWSREVQARK